ncbi:hypothetical protein [Haloarchaeobius iranensis]|uniref:Uncharacterized protein n=1 Tax=Haloarchaeobius iranensis TaxID=996166 RepID=A0A1G9ZBK2_9EURY|nr:hypothetical protein [Haloarchaeobius iranensis]SDN18684.1 hypothetical protein SAMN05192554_11938 [Haloarchaeobius iranensis]
MVPDLPSLSRRRLLGSVAGLATLGAGTTAAVGVTEPTALPDRLTDAATRHYPTPPEVTAHWRPTVTEDHAGFAVELLARTVEQSEPRWERLDRDRPFTGAGGWLEDARQDLRSGKTHDALWKATYGLQFAGEYLGEARWALGEVTLDELAERGEALRDRVDAVVATLDPYRVSDPATDLAWYLQIEQEALRADQRTEWWAADEDGSADERNPDDVEATGVGEATAKLLQAEVNVESAERFQRHLADRLGSDARPHAGALQSARAEFQLALSEVPSEDEVLARFGLGDGEQTGPYALSHRRLADWCFPTAAPAPWTTAVDEELRVATVVALSQGVARVRAHRFAVDELVVDEGDSGFDSGHVLAEKRRARSVYRSVVGADPPPLLTRQAGRAVEDLQVATVDEDAGSDWEIWRARLQAYLYALVGRAKLREYPAVYRTVVERE